MLSIIGSGTIIFVVAFWVVMSTIYHQLSKKLGWVGPLRGRDLFLYRLSVVAFPVFLLYVFVTFVVHSFHHRQ